MIDGILMHLGISDKQEQVSRGLKDLTKRLTSNCTVFSFFNFVICLFGTSITCQVSCLIYRAGITIVQKNVIRKMVFYIDA